MNMIFRQRQYVRGEVVGRVDLAKLFGPLEVPVEPERWYILRVFPGRERQVMKTFRRRNVSAWMPLLPSIETVTIYRRGYEVETEQQVMRPMITGALLLPDFEAVADRWKGIEGVIGIHQVGPCVPVLMALEVAQLRNIEAAGNTPKSKRERKFAIGELVRVTEGPFAAFAGRVERFDSGSRLSVGLDLFGRVTHILIDESGLEPASAAKVAARLPRKRSSFRRIPPGQ